MAVKSFQFNKTITGRKKKKDIYPVEEQITLWLPFHMYLYVLSSFCYIPQLAGLSVWHLGHEEHPFPQHPGPANTNR